MTEPAAAPDALPLDARPLDRLFDVRLFDVYLVVDWSARNVPATGRDSVWIAELAGDGPPALSNPRTRIEAETELRSIVARRHDRRVLLTIDVALGYPAGSAELFGLSGTPWWAMWCELAALVSDDTRNRNNRFEVAAELNRRAGMTPGPFWGSPPARTSAHLGATKPMSATSPVAELRETERALRALDRHPKSVWQLLGAGSVGSQTLTALPVLHRLRTDLGDRLQVWPFTTGLAAREIGSGTVTVAETWPSLFTVAGIPAGTVRDAHQVASTATALLAADVSGELAGWFTIDCAAGLRETVEREEGWILAPARDVAF